jgi:hypothetical protein
MKLSLIVVLALVVTAGVEVQARRHRSAPAPKLHRAPKPAAVQAGTQLSLSVDAECSYTISVRGSEWLTSADTGIRVGGEWFSTSAASPAGANLKLNGQTTSTGIDSIGEYSMTECQWIANGSEMFTGFKSYANAPALVFTQRFPAAVATTGASDPNPDVDGICTSFPSFTPAVSGLGFLSYVGQFMEDTRAGLWDENAGNWITGISSGLWGGPTVLYPSDQSKGRDVMVISSYSQFMSASQLVSNTSSIYSLPQLALGVMGGVVTIPEEYSTSSILYLGEDVGIRETLQGWGQVLKTEYQKPDRVFETDPHVKFLSYNTDRGSAYW